jgi:hypothetical protein
MTEKNELSFESYEEALEVAAEKRLEIDDIFKKSANRCRKIFELIFEGEKSSDFNFVKDLLYYQAGIPTDESKARIENFRQQIAAMVRLYAYLGNLENLQAYFAEVGVAIDFAGINEATQPLLVGEKLNKVWDVEFPADQPPAFKIDALKMIMDRARVVQDDIVHMNDVIKTGIAEYVENNFDVDKSSFGRAVDIMLVEKKGNSVDEKLQDIDDKEKALAKALAPFRGEE